MNRLLKKSTGFGAVEIVLLVAVAGLLGFTGWYVFQAKTEADEVLNQSASSGQAANRPAVTPQSDVEQPQDSMQAEYLEVKEWGVRFELDSLTRDAVYRIVNDRQLALSTKTYSRLGACGANDAMRTGYLFRAKAGYRDERISPSIDSESFKPTNKKVKVGEYYYFWEGPQAPCAEPTDENIKLMEKYQPVLRELAARMEPG